METNFVTTPVVTWQEQIHEYAHGHDAKVGKWIVGSAGMGRVGIEGQQGKVQGKMQTTGNQSGLGQLREGIRCSGAGGRRGCSLVPGVYQIMEVRPMGMTETILFCEYCGHRSCEGCSTCDKNICTKCHRHEGEPEDCEDWPSNPVIHPSFPISGVGREPGLADRTKINEGGFLKIESERSR